MKYTDRKTYSSFGKELQFALDNEDHEEAYKIVSIYIDNMHITREFNEDEKKIQATKPEAILDFLKWLGWKGYELDTSHRVKCDIIKIPQNLIIDSIPQTIDTCQTESELADYVRTHNFEQAGYKTTEKYREDIAFHKKRITSPIHEGSERFRKEVMKGLKPGNRFAIEEKITPEKYPEDIGLSIIEYAKKHPNSEELKLLDEPTMEELK